MVGIIKYSMKWKNVGMVAELLNLNFKYELVDHPMGLDGSFWYFFKGINTFGSSVKSLKHCTKLTLTQVSPQGKITDCDFFVRKDIFWVGPWRRAWTLYDVFILPTLITAEWDSIVKVWWRFFIFIWRALWKISCYVKRTLIRIRWISARPVIGQRLGLFVFVGFCFVWR